MGNKGSQFASRLNGDVVRREAEFDHKSDGIWGEAWAALVRRG